MNVAVLGGTDGARDIAAALAIAGHAVSLHASDATVAMDRIEDIDRMLVDAAERGEIDEDRLVTATDELEATTGLPAAVSGTDLVIETTTSDSDELQQRFAEIESAVERETLIATSVPAVSVTAAAAGLRQPDRALGLQFFEPPDPPVVELLIAEQTTQEPANRATEFIESLGATPVRVADGPGVVSSRLALALEAEAMRIIEEEASTVDGVDTLLRRGSGHPEGPLERADRAGLDIRLAQLETLQEEFGARFEPPELLREMVEDGRTGTTVGEGFYIWEAGEPIEPAIEGPALPERGDQPDDPAIERE